MALAKTQLTCTEGALILFEVGWQVYMLPCKRQKAAEMQLRLAYLLSNPAFITSKIIERGAVTPEPEEESLTLPQPDP